MKGKFSWAFVVLILVPFAGYWGLRLFGPGLGSEARQELREAEVFELLTLKPVYTHHADATEPGIWHDCEVLGRVAVTDPKLRTELIESLNRSVRERGTMFACFNPRHAIHAVWKGKSVDVVICFECEQFDLYDGDQHWHGTLSKYAKEKFEAVVVRLGLPVPEE